MTKPAMKLRDKWIKEEPKLMLSFIKDKDAISTINALAQVVSDYKSNK